MVPARSNLLEALGEIVGRHHVLVGETASGYLTDWTGRFGGHGAAVVRPADVPEVAALVRTCAAEGVAIVPQGGNTGLVGGSVPQNGEVVVSLARFDVIDPPDRDARRITAGAGVTLAALQASAASVGLEYPIDLAARDSATVGGMIATNAGGVHVLRYGTTRRQLMGMEAVLGDGRIVCHLTGLEKDNTGYDLAGLLCGSEGTLGVVVRACLRLVERPPEKAVALLGFGSAADAVAASADLRSCQGLEAVELSVRSGMELVCRALAVPPPFEEPAEAYLTVEVAGARAPESELADMVDQLPATLTALATDTVGRSRLWRYRELLTEAIATVGVPRKFDVSLPPGAIESFVEVVQGATEALGPTVRCWIFGHVLDGNLHVNITGLDVTDDGVDELVLGLVAERGGSISAEHGIGVAKKRWLHLNRSADEIESFRAIKSALDPEGIMNPNVLLPEPG